jgi:uncharacterized protein YfaT (DUF1175 family)
MAVKRLLVVFMGLFLLAGCRDSKSPPEAKPAQSTAEESVEPTVLQDGIPGTPEAAIRQMMEGLKANRPVVIWQAMPKPFQQEINGLVREFAKKMDPQLWKKSFTTWEKLARLLAEKKSAILSHPELANLSSAERQRLEQHWDGLVELLTILVHSELGDLAQLESFEMGRFLEQTGGRWLTQLAALSESLGQDSLSGMLAGLTPKTLKLNGDKATMGWMTEGSPVPVSQFYLIHVDGRWVPSGWVAAWERIREWRGKVRQTTAESFTLQSGEKLKTLAQAERILDALLATKTAEELHQTLAKELSEPTVGELAAIVRTLSGGTKAVPESAVPPPAGVVPQSPTDAGSVTLIVSGATEPGDEDLIFDALNAALPGDVDVQFDGTPTGLKVIVGPVGDLEEFRKGLTFGTITKMDAKQRIVHIDMKR